MDKRTRRGVFAGADTAIRSYPGIGMGLARRHEARAKPDPDPVEQQPAANQD